MEAKTPPNPKSKKIIFPFSGQGGGLSLDKSFLMGAPTINDILCSITSGWYYTTP